MVLYRILISIVAPFLLLSTVLKMGRAKDRLGLTLPDNTGPRLWFHAASNGELNSVRPVIKLLLSQRPDLCIVITTNTITGRKLALDWKLAGCEVLLAPIDLRWVHQRFLKSWQITGLVIVENELWPNRIFSCARSGIPVAMIGARLSARSAERWANFRALFSNVLDRVKWASAQDTASQDRLTALGLAQEKWLPVIDLKTLYQPPPMPPDFEAHKVLYDRRMTILAASTHEGEEQILLDAWGDIRKSFPKARLILAIRHPKRRDDIIVILQKMQLPFVQHSKGQMPVKDTQVILADTMGEMHMWYNLAAICFVGGSLVEKGGHTPYEPIYHGCAIMHGPSIENFAEIYQNLDATKAAVCTSARMLSDDLKKMFDAQMQEDLSLKAKACLPLPADLDAVVVSIEKMCTGSSEEGR